MLVPKPMYYVVWPPLEGKPTLYYVSGGVWQPKLSDRVLLRLYEKKELADIVQRAHPGSEVHSTEVMVEE